MCYKSQPIDKVEVRASLQAEAFDTQTVVDYTSKRKCLSTLKMSSANRGYTNSKNMSLL